MLEISKTVISEWELQKDLQDKPYTPFDEPEISQLLQELAPELSSVCFIH